MKTTVFTILFLAPFFLFSQGRLEKAKENLSKEFKKLNVVVY